MTDHAANPEFTDPKHDAGDDPHEHGHDEPHAVPLWILFVVFAALIFLTFLTVAVTWVDLGALNIWIALLIAAIKAVIVGLYFMHLYWDNPFNTIILLIALAFLVIFIGGAMTDAQQYEENMTKPSIIKPR